MTRPEARPAATRRPRASASCPRAPASSTRGPSASRAPAPPPATRSPSTPGSSAGCRREEPLDGYRIVRLPLYPDDASGCAEAELGEPSTAERARRRPRACPCARPTAPARSRDPLSRVVRAARATSRRIVEAHPRAPRGTLAGAPTRCSTGSPRSAGSGSSRGSRCAAAWFERQVEPHDIWHGMWAGSLPALVAGPARGTVARTVYDARDVFLRSRTRASMPGWERGILTWYERRWAHAADAVIQVSEPYAAMMQRDLGLGDIPVVRNCPDRWDPPEPRPDRIRELLGIPPETAIVLYQGLLMSDRGIEQAMDAILEVPDAVLVLMGFGDQNGRESSREDYQRSGAARHPGRARCTSSTRCRRRSCWTGRRRRTSWSWPIQPNSENHQLRDAPEAVGGDGRGRAGRGRPTCRAWRPSCPRPACGVLCDPIIAGVHRGGHPGAPGRGAGRPPGTRRPGLAGGPGDLQLGGPVRGPRLGLRAAAGRDADLRPRRGRSGGQQPVERVRQPGQVGQAGRDGDRGDLRLAVDPDARDSPAGRRARRRGTATRRRGRAATGRRRTPGRTPPSVPAPACRTRSPDATTRRSTGTPMAAARHPGSPRRCWTGWPAASPDDAARCSAAGTSGNTGQPGSDSPSASARPAGTTRPSASRDALRALPPAPADRGCRGRPGCPAPARGSAPGAGARRHRGQTPASAARSPPIQSMSVP